MIKRIEIEGFTVFIEIGNDFDPTTWVEEYEDTKYIALSDRWSLDVAVDPIDYEWAKQFLWCHTYGSSANAFDLKGRNKIYARRSVAIPNRVTPSGRPAYGNLWLHREITERAYGPPPSKFHVSDHLDGDTLNCKRENLRWATLSENSRNKYGIAWLQTRMNFDAES